MTVSEFRNLVSKSPNVDWLNNISFHFYNEKAKLNFNAIGASEIYKFVSQQTKGWIDKGELSSVFEIAKNKFSAFKASLEHFIQTHGLNNLDVNTLNSHWQNEIYSPHAANPQQYLDFRSPEVDFLIKVQKNFPNYFSGSYEFLFGNFNSQQDPTNRDFFIGNLMAYEFSTKDSSLILSRKDAESSALQQRENILSDYLNGAEKQFTDLLKQIQDDKEAYTKLIDDLTSEKGLKFDGWFQDSQNGFNKFNLDSTEKINDLEDTYRKKLQLEMPAKYWEQRAGKLKNEASIFLGILILLLLIGGCCLYFLLWKTPEGMLISFFHDDKAIALRWSIVFITFISLIFIGLRVVSKVMFSSYHLARDAEERQQLTYVYLALRKDASVDEKDRQLIMQSLFSRADTGLLKEDSSPTMPGGLDKIFK